MNPSNSSTHVIHYLKRDRASAKESDGVLQLWLSQMQVLST